MKRLHQSGFTLIELITVIVIVAILATFALPRFANLQQNSRVAVLQGMQGSMRSAIAVARVNALANGLSVLPSNPGNSAQDSHLIQMEGFSVEVDWRNLCPESSGERGDAKDMYHFLNLTESTLTITSDITSTNTPQINTLNGQIQLWYGNRYTVVGYDLDQNPSRNVNYYSNLNPGCYVFYDSFGLPECTINMVTDEC